MLVDQNTINIITNGVASGPIAEGLGHVHSDPGLLRPFIDGVGNKYCSVRTGKAKVDASGAVVCNVNGDPVPETIAVPLQTLVNNGTVPFTFNATALPRQVWQMIDRDVLKATRAPMQAWGDLRSANTFSGFDGMATTSLIRDTMTDAGTATVDMDGISEPQGGEVIYTPDILPLPITHSGFKVSERKLASSRNGGTPFDTTMAEQCGRRVAESIERMCIGTLDQSTLVHGTSAEFANRGVYGYITQPNRMTKTIVAVGSQTPESFVTAVLEMVQQASLKNFYGPFMLYHSPNWSQFLNTDYVVGTAAQGLTTVTETVRDRTLKIDEISGVSRLNFLTTDNTLLLVQMTSDTVRAVNGLEMTTVQWDTRGGNQHNFQVMAIQVPDLRAAYVGTENDSDDRVCGIVHASV